MDFETLWTFPARQIDAPNRRGHGTSTVGVIEPGAWPVASVTTRLYIKRQQAFFCRPAWNAYRATPTLRREVRLLQRAARAGLTVPNVIDYAEGDRDRAVLVLAGVAGAVGLDRSLQVHNQTERTVILTNVATVFVALHRARIRHGALYPKHVLIGSAPAYEVTLIDFEKARRVALRSWAAASDLERFFRRTTFLSAAERARLTSHYIPRQFPLLKTFLAE